jgi:maltose/moltooligosaccharide transporter
MSNKRLWGRIAFLGLGFLALGPTTGLYDAFMPIFLAEFIASASVIGLIMGLDNLMALIFYPFFGSLSDRTETRIGRRLPFILIGMPLVAIGMFALPFGKEVGLPLLILASLVMNFSITICRPAILAMMPDITPSKQRSVGFGIMISMLGIGSIIGTGIGRQLYLQSHRYPFMLGAGMLLAVFLIFLLFLREPKERQSDSKVEETPQHLWQSLKDLITNPDRVTLFLFFAIALMFMAQHSVTTWFTTYGSERFFAESVSADVRASESSKGLIVLGLMLVLFAIPSGFVGTKLGRRRTVLIGLSGMVVSLVLLFLASTLTQAIGGMALFGMSLMLGVINMYPMALELSQPSQVGTYSGLFVMCQYGAGIFGPPVLGLVFDLVGSKRPMFLVVAIYAVLSLVLILRIRKGVAEAEAPPSSIAPTSTAGA